MTTPRIRRGQIVATPDGRSGFVHKVDGRVAFLRSVTDSGRLTVGGMSGDVTGEWLTDRLSVIEDAPDDEAGQDALPPGDPEIERAIARQASAAVRSCADKAWQDMPPPVPPDGLEARDRAGHRLPIALVLFVVASIPATLTAMAIAKALGFAP